MWFLYCLFIIFVIFPGIAFLYDRYSVSRLIIPVVLFGMILISPKVPSVLTLSNVFRYLFVFYLGFVVKKNLPLLSERWNRLKKYVPILTVFSFVLWCAAVILICDVKDILLFRLLAGFFGMVSIISAVLRFSDSVLLKPFENIGKYSLQLYLLNGYTLTAARVIMVNLLGVTSALPIIAFNMVLTLGGSYLVIHFIIGKVKPFRFICGM